MCWAVFKAYEMMLVIVPCQIVSTEVSAGLNLVLTSYYVYRMPIVWRLNFFETFRVYNVGNSW